MKTRIQAFVLFFSLGCFSTGCTYDVEHVFASENCKTDNYGFPEIPDWRFENVTLLGDTSYITDVFFISEGKGLLFTYSAIWLTLDDGDHWEKVFSGTPLYMYSATFSDEQHGFVTGSLEGKYCILRTKDGGHTWTVLDLNTEDWILRFSFADSLNGVATFYHWTNDPHARRAYYSKSSDGGASWQVMPDLSASPNSNVTMKMCSNGFGYLPGTSGEIHLTENFGVSWTTIHTDFTSAFNLQFLDVNTGFVGVFQSLHKTTDGGNTWIKISDDWPNWFYFFSPTDGVSLQSTDLDFDLDQDLQILCKAFLTTSDGGIKWLEGPPSVNFEMSDIQFVHDRLGFGRSNDPAHKFVKLYR